MDEDYERAEDEDYYDCAEEEHYYGYGEEEEHYDSDDYGYERRRRGHRTKRRFVRTQVELSEDDEEEFEYHEYDDFEYLLEETCTLTKGLFYRDKAFIHHYDFKELPLFFATHIIKERNMLEAVMNESIFIRLAQLYDEIKRRKVERLDLFPAYTLKRLTIE